MRLATLTGNAGRRSWLLLSSTRVCARLTSSGPPPSSPTKPGSLTQKYESFIGRWPKLYAIHRIVVDGSRWCFSDVKTFFAIKRKLSAGESITKLSVPQLEVAVQSPVEGPKLAVVVTLLPLPLTVYVIGFAIVFFPRVVLTRHFWTDEQRKEFFLADILRSMSNAPSVFPPTIKSLYDSNMSEFSQLTDNDVRQIGKLHGLYPLPGLRSRLKRRVEALRQLDLLMPDYINDLSPRQLYFHMYIRRLNYVDLSDADIRQRLLAWRKFASNLDGTKYLVAPYYFNNLNK